MTKNAATEEALGALHGKVARVMTTALDQLDSQQEIYDKLSKEAVENECSERMAEALEKAPELNASLMSVITKFLSDNKISCAPSESEELSGLAATLAKKRERRSIGNVAHIEDYKTG